MLRKERIATTIMKLMRSGKKMPQDMAYGKDSGKEAERILKETVDLWAELFGNTGAERWEKAERIALTLTNVQGLNVNVVTPALMQAALKQAETEYVQQNITANDESKHQPWGACGSEDNKVLWQWTYQKIAEGRVFGDYMPDDKTVINYGRKIGLADAEIMKQRSVPKAYLNDAKFAAVNKSPIRSKLFVLAADNGKMVRMELI